MGFSRCNTHCFLLTVLATLLTVHDFGDSTCGVFVFPSVTDGRITRPEHTTLTLPFELNHTCHPAWNNNLTVSVSRSKDDLTASFCSIRHYSNGTCMNDSLGNTFCVCGPTAHTYTLTKTLNRSDTVTWWWSVNVKNMVDTKPIVFNVTYNAMVKRLILLDSSETKLVSEGVDGDVICFWENGNPPTKARLLNRHGGVMESEESTRQIRHTFKQIRCEDAGEIRCEAPGASQNVSSTLLVKCPPEIILDQNEVKVKPGENVQLKLNIRSYTKDITDCRMVEVFRSETSRGPQNCDGGLTNLTGSPPDLTLTLQIDDIKEDEDGEWTLEMTNDAGTGKIQFKLHVEKSQDMTIEIAIGSGAAGTAAVVGFIVAFALMARRFCNRTKVLRIRNRGTTSPDDEGSGRQSRTSSRSGRGSHVYHEADEEAVHFLRGPGLALQRVEHSHVTKDHVQDSEASQQARQAPQDNNQPASAREDIQEFSSSSKGAQASRVTQEDSTRQPQLQDLSLNPKAVVSGVRKDGKNLCISLEVVLEPTSSDTYFESVVQPRQTAAPYECLPPAPKDSGLTTSCDANRSDVDAESAEKKFGKGLSAGGLPEDYLHPVASTSDAARRTDWRSRVVASPMGSMEMWERSGN